MTREWFDKLSNVEFSELVRTIRTTKPGFDCPEVQRENCPARTRAIVEDISQEKLPDA